MVNERKSQNKTPMPFLLRHPQTKTIHIYLIAFLPIPSSLSPKSQIPSDPRSRSFSLTERDPSLNFRIR